MRVRCWVGRIHGNGLQQLGLSHSKALSHESCAVFGDRRASAGSTRFPCPMNGVNTAHQSHPCIIRIIARPNIDDASVEHVECTADIFEIQSAIVPSLRLACCRKASTQGIEIHPQHGLEKRLDVGPSIARSLWNRRNGSRRVRSGAVNVNDIVIGTPNTKKDDQIKPDRNCFHGF